MAALCPQHQAFLQVLLAKRAVTEDEATGILAKIGGRYGLGQAGSDVNQTLTTINKSLKSMNMEIRSMPVDGGLVHTVVNLASDEVAEKRGSRLTTAQIDIFKHALKNIGDSADDESQQRTNYDKFSAAQQITIDHLVFHKWLVRDTGSSGVMGQNVRVGPRSFLELPELLEENGIARSQVIYH